MGLIKNNELRGLSVYSHVNYIVEIEAIHLFICVTLSIQDINMFLYKLNKEVTLDVLCVRGKYYSERMLLKNTVRFQTFSSEAVFLVSWERPAPHSDLLMPYQKRWPLFLGLNSLDSSFCFCNLLAC